MGLYEKEWESAKDKEKKAMGIPLDLTYTFDIFYAQFKDLIATGLDATYQMTLYQVMGWDESVGLPPHEMVGIEGGVDEADYILKDNIDQENLLGGKKRTTKYIRNKRTKKIRRK